jgi:hypothetical protein
VSQSPADFHNVRWEDSRFGDPSSNRLCKGSTPYGCAQLLAKSGLDYLDAPALRDDAAISYDGEVEVVVECQARAWSERGVDHVRLNPAGTS